MATINNTSGITLKQSTAYTRSFYFGNTGASVAVSLSKAGAAFATASNSPATEIANGFYKITLSSSSDTATLGDLAFNCSSTTSGSTTQFSVWTDQVASQIFTDISLDATGHSVASGNLRQNIAFNNFPFTMTFQGSAKAGLTVTAQKNFGTGWSSTTNFPTDGGNGAYFINLSAADLNSASVTLLFTAPGADPSLVNIVTMP